LWRELRAQFHLIAHLNFAALGVTSGGDNPSATTFAIGACAGFSRFFRDGFLRQPVRAGTLFQAAA
jgi:hypothetical protein